MRGITGHMPICVVTSNSLSICNNLPRRSRREGVWSTLKAFFDLEKSCSLVSMHPSYHMSQSHFHAIKPNKIQQLLEEIYFLLSSCSWLYFKLQVLSTKWERVSQNEVAFCCDFLFQPNAYTSKGNNKQVGPWIAQKLKTQIFWCLAEQKL